MNGKYRANEETNVDKTEINLIYEENLWFYDFMDLANSDKNGKHLSFRHLDGDPISRLR